MRKRVNRDAMGRECPSCRGSKGTLHFLHREEAPIWKGDVDLQRAILRLTASLADSSKRTFAAVDKRSLSRRFSPGWFEVQRGESVLTDPGDLLEDGDRIVASRLAQKISKHRAEEREAEGADAVRLIFAMLPDQAFARSALLDEVGRPSMRRTSLDTTTWSLDDGPHIPRSSS